MNRIRNFTIGLFIAAAAACSAIAAPAPAPAPRPGNSQAPAPAPRPGNSAAPVPGNSSAPKPNPAAAMRDIMPEPPVINAKAWMLMDSETGRVLLGQNEHERIYPASLTKMMTSYIIGQEIRSVLS